MNDDNKSSEMNPKKPNQDPNKEATSVTEKADSDRSGIPIPPPQTNSQSVKSDVQGSDRSHLSALLLAIMFPIGLTRVYTGHRDGLFRVVWALGLMALLIITAIAAATTGFDGGIAMLFFVVVLAAVVSVPILYIWGFIDILLSLSRKTDAKGLVLRTSERDTKWAKTIFYVYIALIILYLLIPLVASAALWSSGVNYIERGSGSWSI